MVGDRVNGFGFQGAKEVAANDEGTAAPYSWPGNPSVAVAANFDLAAELTNEKAAARRTRRVVGAINECVSIVVCVRGIARDCDGPRPERNQHSAAGFGIGKNGLGFAAGLLVFAAGSVELVGNVSI